MVTWPHMILGILHFDGIHLLHIKGRRIVFVRLITDLLNDLLNVFLSELASSSEDIRAITSRVEVNCR